MPDFGIKPTVVESSADAIKIKNARFDGDGNPYGNEDADRLTTAKLETVDRVPCVVVTADVDWLISAHVDAEAPGKGFAASGEPQRTDSVSVAVPIERLRELIGLTALAQIAERVPKKDEWESANEFMVYVAKVLDEHEIPRPDRYEYY